MFASFNTYSESVGLFFDIKNKVMVADPAPDFCAKKNIYIT